MRALDHFRTGHEKLENYVQSLNEVLSNLELGAETLVDQSDEFVCRQSMQQWGLPCSSFSYSTDVHLGLPTNYKRVMLTEQLPASEMWTRGDSANLVVSPVTILRAKNNCKPSSFSDDMYFDKKKKQSVRYENLIPIGGASYL